MKVFFALATSALVPAMAFGQADVEIEGPVSAITSIGAEIAMTVMGVDVRVPVGTTIETPVTKLTFAQLLNTASLPGRSQPGFIGGTAIVTGKTVAGSTSVVADSIAIEPAENVLLGIVTKNDSSGFEVNGVTIKLIADDRLQAIPPRNEFGFAIKLSSVAIGTPVSVEGYFDGSAIQAFIIDVDGPADLLSNAIQIAITRVQTRERTPNATRGDEIELRGSVTMTHTTANTQPINIFRIDDGVETFLDSALATRDTTFTNFGSFRYSESTAPSSNPVLGRVPRIIKVVNASPDANSVATQAEAEVRE